ncbi:MAG: lyase family protein [Planctomycetota bacterium]
MRTEHDALGSLELPDDCLYGIHTARARDNFDIADRSVSAELIHAYGMVKQACCRVNVRLGYLQPDLAEALEAACEELIAGQWDQQVVVDALAGGAGTSVNMNVNEVLANRCLQRLGHVAGDYAHCDPLDHVNLHQSTNDTFPTALRVAALRLLRDLEQAVIAALEACQDRERAFADVVKVGRTQWQDAVLMTLGREFGAFADALARDRWRVHKCEERLRVVNLGGTAIGTGLGAPRQFIFRVVDELRHVSHLPVARAENMVDATANQDAIVEAAGMLAALASNLLKIGGDLRRLSSGPAAGIGEIHLPPRQAGSSIMPGKINPVIPEAVQQAALRAMAAS